MKLERPTKLGYLELRALMERRPFSILSWSSGLLALTFVLYYGLTATTNPQLGFQFVQSEWPPPGLSPYFYAKPITWFAYFSFLYWTFGLEAKRARFLTLSPEVRRFLFIGTAVRSMRSSSTLQSGQPLSRSRVPTALLCLATLMFSPIRTQTQGRRLT